MILKDKTYDYKCSFFGYSVQIFFILENKAVGASLKISVIAPCPHLKMEAIAPLLRGLQNPLAALSLAALALFKLSVRQRAGHG